VLLTGQEDKMLLHANGYFESKKMPGAKSSVTKHYLLQKDLHKYSESIITRRLHPLQSSHRSEQSLQLQLETGGKSTCSISIVLS
jgi:hypothetical protein